ncbi:hypothetical protein VOLCADRAFT_60205 [Volvox carteri f. nagariensis]|uniref:Protein kinase domain-containing protein n=1 Tax=Volvox carteri f. nagariensis TaxID=3068 RepID=D8TVK3_VOLCA|nr:uncharacterized protein VOLCADRAFT_60205 [Volvox carteri f. nagariensis]EFJ48596.1 hypothetical protein VOLCADRAFT_60205 [Volvox carteri f. nagariensis]|eukprot:XP_002950395.1 hypothetical protein VOLCADRAFT_60205 [Volvox carteri f. nagariensis]
MGLLADGCSNDSAECALQRFELLGRNGAGANSTVFKCRDTASGAIVAVKKLEGSTVPQVRLQLPLTYLQAAIMRACAHENCVTLLEAHQGLTSGVIYLVMEHAEHSLSRELLLNPRGLPLPKAKLVIFQLASALELIHGKKVVHGDIKPANVLLTAQCNSKLCDFGSATSVVLSGGDDSTQALRTDEVSSRWYCAPESLLGAPGSAASDIWALGCILGELVTGKPLMAGGQNELDQLSCVVAMIGQLSRAQEKLLQLLPRQQRAKLEEARARGPLLDRYAGWVGA